MLLFQGVLVPGPPASGGDTGTLMREHRSGGWWELRGGMAQVLHVEAGAAAEARALLGKRRPHASPAGWAPLSGPRHPQPPAMALRGELLERQSSPGPPGLG